MDRVYTLRRAVPADAKEIAGLFQRSVRGLSSKNYSTLQITTWARLGADDRQWEDRIQFQYVLLSEYAEAVVGFVGYEDEGHIDTLYVCPDHARQGVASRLLANILDRSIRNGLTRLYSEVSITARPFFEAHGFEVVAPQTVERDGVSFLNFRMQKILH